VERSAEALIEFHRRFGDVFLREEQRRWSLFYLCGQLANLERKTIEPMVLALYGIEEQAVRALQHFIGDGRWSAQAAIGICQDLIGEWLGDPDGVVIVDGSGFPKQGEASVGVARQYCGALGKVANCQEGVFVTYVSRWGYTFLDARLYLPESWFGEDHRQRWKKCGVPSDVVFQTEPELALHMVSRLVEHAVVPFQWVLGDERFGQNPAFLDGVQALGKWYVAEVPAQTQVWRRTPSVQPPGRGPLGRPRTRPRLAQSAPAPIQMQQLAEHMTWSRHTIHEGSKGPLVAEFAFARVTNVRNGLPGTRLWAMFRRHPFKPTEIKFYLSNAPLSCSQATLIQMSGLRWPIETTFEEGKSEVGLDHYETRSWLGWHHHIAHTFMAHLFLISLRLDFQKKSSPVHTPSASVDRQGDCRRHTIPRHHRSGALSSTTQSRRVSLTPQTHLPQISIASKSLAR
jgi:SRSO17 transposase